MQNTSWTSATAWGISCEVVVGRHESCTQQTLAEVPWRYSCLELVEMEGVEVVMEELEELEEVKGVEEVQEEMVEEMGEMEETGGQEDMIFTQTQSTKI